jgi:RNA polymerase sigma-B factor
VIATTVSGRDISCLTDEQLFQIYSERGDSAVRAELVRRFLPFARKLALRYLHSREPLEDLVQVASLGLLNAVDRFDPGRGRSFTAYAAPTILGELKRHFRDKGWSLHVPRDLKERALAASQRTERLSIELGRSPTVDELAAALDCTIEETTEALDAGDNYHPQSLDAVVGEDDDDRCPLLEMLGDKDDGYELAEDRQALAAGWIRLSDTEREVLGLRLLRDLTQREISQRIGCSQMHVSRLLRKTMLHLDATTHDAGVSAVDQIGNPDAAMSPSACPKRPRPGGEVRASPRRAPAPRGSVTLHHSQPADTAAQKRVSHRTAS